MWADKPQTSTMFAASVHHMLCFRIKLISSSPLLQLGAEPVARFLCVVSGVL